MIINLTPHEIILVGNNGEERFPPSGMVARCQTEREVVGELDGFPISRNNFGKIEGLPEPTKGTFFLVSFPVLQALGGKRGDVLSPDTTPGSVIRNDAGQITGVKGFQVL